jgi:hypothetical protein
MEASGIGGRIFWGRRCELRSAVERVVVVLVFVIVIWGTGGPEVGGQPAVD